MEQNGKNPVFRAISLELCKRTPDTGDGLIIFFFTPKSNNAHATNKIAILSARWNG